MLDYPIKKPVARFRWQQRWANAWWKEEVQSETFNRFSISPDKFYFLTLQLRESRFQGQKVIVWATPECCNRSPPDDDDGDDDASDGDGDDYADDDDPDAGGM